MAITLGDILGSGGAYYDLVWDGGRGALYLNWPSGGVFYASTASTSGVYTEYLHEPQDVTAWSGGTGPGYVGVKSLLHHRVVFVISSGISIPRYFDGYFFSDAGNPTIVGVTWDLGVPVGFYARMVYRIPG